MCKPDWDFWKHKTTVEKWQAAFLSCDINPGTQSYRDIKNYGLDNEKVSKRLRLLKDNSHLRVFFSPSIINIGDSNLSHVKLAEFAAWCLDRNYDIPQELAALAKKPDTATAAKSEKQDTNLTQSKQESEETSTQDTTTDAQNKDKKDALAIADILLSKGGVLDEVIGLAIQKAESMHNSKVWTELWALSNEPKRPFTSGTKGGGLPYYGSSHGAIKRLNKKAFDKRLAHLKKRYL